MCECKWDLIMSDVEQTGKNRIGAGKPGPGRPKGSPNKNTKALREMILKALDDVGGEKYLARQAIENPGPFMTLVGKVQPTSGDLTVAEQLDQMDDETLDREIARLSAATAAKHWTTAEIFRMRPPPCGRCCF